MSSVSNIHMILGVPVHLEYIDGVSYSDLNLKFPLGANLQKGLIDSVCQTRTLL